MYIEKDTIKDGQTELNVIGNVRHPERGIYLVMSKMKKNGKRKELSKKLDEDEARWLANTLLMCLCEEYDESFI